MNRILIIGLDGASPHLIKKWQESLPNLSQLMKNGASGTLTSVIPPRSIPAWYCFATGMNPAKLGVFGFSQRRPQTYDYTFANFTYCQAFPFWYWLNQQGITTGIVHLPGTYPPRPLSGFMISGWPGPLNRGNLIYTHPAELSREIDDGLKRPFELVSPKSIEKNNDADLLKERLRILEMHGDVAYKLLSEKEWQVATVVLSPVDRASHQFWRHMDPGHPQYHPTLAKQFGDALQKVYEASDAQVGRLLTLIDDEDWVFIVSDHGFGPVRRTFYLNEWLRQKGFLVLKENAQTGKISFGKKLLGKAAAPLFWLNQASPCFRRLAEPFKKRTLSNALRNSYVQIKEEGLVRINHLPIDWSRTRAYCPDESSLYLNLQDRDPEGIVAPGEEANHVLDEIENELRNLKDPETAVPISVQIHRKEDVYSGPFLAEAPDMIIDMDNYQTEVMAELQEGLLMDYMPVRSGNHTLEGTLIAVGPGIPAGSHVDANLIDIVPTILHMMKTPVPQDMDGQVIFGLFKPDSKIRQREVEWETAVYDSAQIEPFTIEEQAQVEKQLRDLGYLN